jgi:hypothetical protein
MKYNTRTEKNEYIIVSAAAEKEIKCGYLFNPKKTNESGNTISIQYLYKMFHTTLVMFFNLSINCKLKLVSGLASLKI